MTADDGMSSPTEPNRVRRDEALRRQLATAQSGPGGPTWLGCLTSGRILVEADDLGRSWSERRAECRRTARLLLGIVSDLEKELTTVRTGRLLRVVAQTSTAAAYCFSVVPDERVVGFTLGPEADPAATDRVLIDLVDRLRLEKGMGSENPGGLSTRRAPEPRATPDAPVDPVVHAIGDPTVTERLSRCLGPRALHCAAVVRGAGVASMVDIFDDSRLEASFLRLSPHERRSFYLARAEGVGPVVRRVNLALRPVLAAPLERLVLDVEQGVIVIHRLDASDHLVGITLRQDDVEVVEQAMWSLAVSERPTIG